MTERRPVSHYVVLGPLDPCPLRYTTMESIYPVRAFIVYRFMFNLRYLDVDDTGKSPGVFPFRRISCSYDGGPNIHLYIQRIYVVSKEETVFEVLLHHGRHTDPRHPASYTPGLLTVPTSIVPASVNGVLPPPPRHNKRTDLMMNVDFVILKTRQNATLHCHFDEAYDRSFHHVLDTKIGCPVTAWQGS